MTTRDDDRFWDRAWEDDQRAGDPYDSRYQPNQWDRADFEYEHNRDHKEERMAYEEALDKQYGEYLRKLKETDPEAYEKEINYGL